MEPTAYLNEYYGNYDEDNRLYSRHGSVEFLTTMRYIGKYVKPGDRVLEIGAGTGRYSHALARSGYAVDAVELIERNIDVFRERTEPGETVTIAQGNALDLSAYPDAAYDITLLLGPMYHLFTEEDKEKALREAVRVTKRGGVVFVAYCISDSSILYYGFADGHIHELIEKKMVDTQTFKAFSNPWDLFELHRKEDIDALMEGFAAERLHYVAADGVSCHPGMRNALAAMDEDTFALYLQYHFATCERPDFVGLTNHALDIFRV